MILTEDLSERIQYLYEVFKRYPVRRDMPHCQCCVTQQDLDVICSKPLRELTGANLGKYAAKALTTWGEVADFKHFLPRLMELVATEGKVHWEDPEVIFRQFREGQWEEWEPPERDAIEAYFVSLWRFALSRYSVPSMTETLFGVTVNDFLCAIAQASDDLSPYLQMWRMDQSEAALRHLADFVVDAVDYEIKHGTLGPWWEGCAAEAQVRAWLLDPATAQKLEEGIVSPSSGSFDASLAEAWRRLARLRGRESEPGQAGPR